MTTPPPSPPDPWAGQPAAVPPNYETPHYEPPNYVPPSYQQPAPGGYGVPAYPTGPAGSAPGYPPNYPPNYPPTGYPPSGYPPSAYPQGYPAGPPPLSEPPIRPTSVSVAFWLWIAVMVVGIVSTVLLFTSDYFAQVAETVRTETGIDSGTAFAAGEGAVRAAVILSTVVTLFIYLFFGSKMYLGRNWARIVLTVLGGLAVLSGLTSTSAVAAASVSRPSDVVALAWIQALLAAVAIVLMYLSASNRYFRDSRIYRAERRQIRL